MSSTLLYRNPALSRVNAGGSFQKFIAMKDSTLCKILTIPQSDLQRTRALIQVVGAIRRDDHGALRRAMIYLNCQQLSKIVQTGPKHLCTWLHWPIIPKPPVFYKAVRTLRLFFSSPGGSSPLEA